MKIIILNKVGDLTGSYHSGGGAVIIAQTEEAAKEALLKESNYCKITPDEWLARVVHECDASKPAVYIFPNKGCC